MHVFDGKKLNFNFFHFPIFGYCLRGMTHQCEGPFLCVHTRAKKSTRGALCTGVNNGTSHTRGQFTSHGVCFVGRDKTWAQTQRRWVPTRSVWIVQLNSWETKFALNSALSFCSANWWKERILLWLFCLLLLDVIFEILLTEVVAGWIWGGGEF